MKELRGFLAFAFGIATVLGAIFTLIVAIEKDLWVLLPIGAAACGFIAHFLSEERTA